MEAGGRERTDDDRTDNQRRAQRPQTNVVPLPQGEQRGKRGQMQIRRCRIPDDRRHRTLAVGEQQPTYKLLATPESTTKTVLTIICTNDSRLPGAGSTVSTIVHTRHPGRAPRLSDPLAGEPARREAITCQPGGQGPRSVIHHEIPLHHAARIALRAWLDVRPEHCGAEDTRALFLVARRSSTNDRARTIETALITDE
jgi:hypothetical protein